MVSIAQASRPNTHAMLPSTIQRRLVTVLPAAGRGMLWVLETSAIENVRRIQMECALKHAENCEKR